MFVPEYIDICRNLVLPREWQEGDWVYGLVDDQLVCLGNGDAKKMMQWASAHLSAIWLPREGDLLDLLKVEGYTNIEISTRLGLHDVVARRVDRDGTTLARQDSYNRPDCLTALACVLRDVKGVES